MKVLLTGAFGNVGQSALEELLRQGHQVRCFDLRTKANERAARRYGDRIEVMWGDLRRPEDVARAVEGRDVVVHLAFIIPKLSATGIESEARPDLAYQVNVEGTRNLIEAMKAQPRPPRLVFSSSLHVYGRDAGPAPAPSGRRPRLPAGTLLPPQGPLRADDPGVRPGVGHPALRGRLPPRHAARPGDV
jgi:nucleoside-diphosphate-sugar epimerase